jgi:hypothetical protein
LAIALVVAAAVALAGCACSDLTRRPAPQSKPVAAPPPTPVLTDSSPDTAGDIKAVWTAVSGTARQDPMGILNSTPLELAGDRLRAKKTVSFKPTATGGATSADGTYVYTLDLRDAKNSGSFKGTMTIDWTMTIVRPDNRNDFHAVYTADVTVSYNPSTKILRDGVATGTAKTTDTYSSGSTSAPNVKTAPFKWTFEGP